jgi:hypothetical protein
MEIIHYKGFKIWKNETDYTYGYFVETHLGSIFHWTLEEAKNYIDFLIGDKVG